MTDASHHKCLAVIACFDTAHGPLSIYNHEALLAVCSALPVVKFMDDQPQTLLEGFTLERWAAYGRRKSSIASRICKENARLKAAIGHPPDALSPTCDRVADKSPIVIDPLMMNDPWCGCSLAHEVSIDNPPCRSMWSSWNRSLNGSEADAVEDGRACASTNESTAYDGAKVEPNSSQSEAANAQFKDNGENGKLLESARRQHGQQATTNIDDVAVSATLEKLACLDEWSLTGVDVRRTTSRFEQAVEAKETEDNLIVLRRWTSVVRRKRKLNNELAVVYHKMKDIAANMAIR